MLKKIIIASFVCLFALTSMAQVFDNPAYALNNQNTTNYISLDNTDDDLSIPDSPIMEYANVTPPIDGGGQHHHLI